MALTCLSLEESREEKRLTYKGGVFFEYSLSTRGLTMSEEKDGINPFVMRRSAIAIAFTLTLQTLRVLPSVGNAGDSQSTAIDYFTIAVVIPFCHCHLSQYCRLMQMPEYDGNRQGKLLWHKKAEM